jgi:predicted RNA methylase
MDDIKKELEDINTKLEEHTQILASVDKTLALQALHLEQHMRRTDLAEENLKILRTEFRPVERHVEVINGIAKFLSVSGAVVGAIYYFLHIIGRA